jgi:hypothetical protein
MQSEPDARSIFKLIKVVVSVLFGAGVGLAISLIGFNRMWQQPILELELQPIHMAIALGFSLMFGIVAAVGIRKFLVEFFDVFSKTIW